MKKITAIIIALAIASLIWAVDMSPNSISATQRTAIEKEILKVHKEMKKAAENFDTETLYEYVLDSNDVIIENGLLRQSRKDAFEITKQSLQGIKELTYSYNHTNINIISLTTVLWTGKGTTKIILEDGRNISSDFAESVFFILQDGQWKVLHAHRSSPK